MELILLFKLFCYMWIGLGGFVCECRVFTKRLSPRTVTTKYGQMRGALVEFPNPDLHPVEAYLGLEYATTLRSQMRFMPPVSPSERWSSIRATFSQRSVCPQTIMNEKELLKQVPVGVVEKRKRMSAFVMSQTEECLSLSIYIPTGLLYCT